MNASQTYGRRIDDLMARTGHPVRRRCLNTLAADRASFVLINNVLALISCIVREANRRRTHGAVSMAYLRGMYSRRTLDRYMNILLHQDDGQGGKDFYLEGDTLHMPHLRHSAADMIAHEAKWERHRTLARERKQRERARHRAHDDPSRMHLTVSLEPFCEVSRLDSSLREENQDTKDMHEDLIAQAIARAEAADSVSSKEPHKQTLTSLEVTELAAAEERAIQAAAKGVELGPIIAPCREQSATQTLKMWGFAENKVKHHRLSDFELNMAVAKIKRAQQPLTNPAGAVVATILRWRSGEWDSFASRPSQTSKQRTA